MSAAIETYTGNVVEPLRLLARDVELEDIAHALSLLCRYNGHSARFYSVAEHSVHCAREALERGYGRAIARWALLHDAGEAYLADVAAPLKPEFPGFSVLEDRVMKAVVRRFRLTPWDEPPVVKNLDRDMLVTEASFLLRSGGAHLGEEYTKGASKLRREIHCWDPVESKEKFLYTADYLGIE